MTEAITQQELIDYLDSDDNIYGLDSISTHGFLTATVVGRPLKNWLSALFEGHEDEVDVSVQQALKNWQQQLLSQLKNEQPIELPFAEQDDTIEIEGDEETIVLMDFSLDSDISIWCVGFVDAMYADDSEDWFDDEDSEDDVAMLTLPMVVLSGIDGDDETLDLRTDEDLLAQMANNIEKNLTELFLLFHTLD